MPRNSREANVQAIAIFALRGGVARQQAPHDANPSGIGDMAPILLGYKRIP